MIGKLINKDIEKILPKNLRESYNGIIESFHVILKEWEAKDGIDEIRIGHGLDKKILDFLIKLTEYTSINYNKLDAKLLSEFLSTFPIKFYYGKSGDDFNYIYDGELGDIFLGELNDFEKIISLKKLNSINGRFKKIIKEFD